ncbi:prephenate dehydratase [Pleionea litopenaei]|uniref:Bifunctional chorismate mutase/prephenate dehydratase n=1 Tax=Pleionea litopenaei TaxID=3070815 RepID=A0AA51X8R2_9GAMM|nr:prephenate dehydratase [Pleionea sp. HL-JVS1]WMS88360.1 prephenate dehydratase [Pleionea sp. HL-JVS1]
MLTSEQLSELRAKIDHLDLALIQLLAERQELCDHVGKHKIECGLDTRDLDREKDLILKKIALGKQSGLSTLFVQQIFQLIIEQSVKLQYQMRVPASGDLNPRVAFLGDHGSYSHQALNKYFSLSKASPRPMGYPSFRAILNSVRNEEMDVGILPIENTTSGAILDVYDLLQGSGIHIIGEEVLDIQHCLVGKAGNIDNVKTILGHPQALAQCSELLQSNDQWKIEYCSSSANAIEQVIKRDDPSVVAIANAFAAEMYQLPVVTQNIANNQKNFTRFILIAKEPVSVPEQIPCKVSLVLSTKQTSGSLATVLNELKSQDIVLTKLQSRPIPEKPWEELFYIDLEGHLDAPNVQAALAGCDNHCQFLKVLGCYPNSQLETPDLYGS